MKRILLVISTHEGAIAILGCMFLFSGVLGYINEKAARFGVLGGAVLGYFFASYLLRKKGF